jgi:ADP-ribose pyrophosphatase YjhB (NUDIX family)
MPENRNIKSRCIIVNEGKMLLCKTIGQDYYFLPGGSLNDTETPQEVLVRELKEEFDSDITEVKELTTFRNTDQSFDETITLFSAKFTDPVIYSTQKMKLKDGSDIEAEWIEIEKIATQNVKILPNFNYLQFIN